jgi:large subunit ribosomal protein L19
MQTQIAEFEQKFRKADTGSIRSGDTVRVHQVISEGGKRRTQVFEGLVIRTRNMNSLSASVLVRRIASGVGVEKSFLLHSPMITKIEVIRRSKVRRNYLSYMRMRGGKSAKLSELSVDKSNLSMNEVVIKAEETEQDHDIKSSQTGKIERTKKDSTEKGDQLTEQSEKNVQQSVDKAVEKKAKAEAFRKSQEDKK